MDGIDRAMSFFAGVALVAFAAATGLTALQGLATPSGTVVTSWAVIFSCEVLGMSGSVAFGALWILRNNKRS